MKKNSKIYIAGHTGLIGSAIFNKLKEEKYKNIITFSHNELDLKESKDVETMFKLYKPQYVFITAAKSGNVHINNTQSGEYLYDNIMIQTNIMESARKNEIKKLIFLSSSGIYPKEIQQPLKEEYLMSGPIELINSAYTISKITGIEMCKAYRKQWGVNYITAILCNVYGPNDNFSLESHIIPTLIRKIYEAKLNNIPQIELWGDGSPKREFMHSDDAANALIYLMNNYNEKQHINVGTGYDVSLHFIAKMIKDIVNYKGDILWNKSYPNGISKKLMDSSLIKELGWEASISLEDGIKDTYNWFINNYKNLKK